MSADENSADSGAKKQGPVGLGITPGRSWGLPEAALGWIGGQFIATALFAAFLAFGYSLTTPQRPGGFLGRAVAQNRAGDGFSNDSIPLVLQMASQIPSWVAMLSITWVVAGVLGRTRPGWSFRGEPLDLARGFSTGFILQIPIVIILVTIVTLVFDIAPDGRALSLIDSVRSPLDLIVLVLGVAVGAPIVEEIFYRGVVQRALVDRFGPVVGIGVASLLFGAVHFSWVNLLPLTVVGAGFGLLAHKYGRLLPAIIAHMTFNAITVVALLSAAG